MSSSSKPLKNSKAARAPTASPGTPPSSPIMQPSNSSKPAVPSSASWGPVVLHQTAPRGQRVADPPQVPPPPTMTVEQFVDLLKLAVGSNTAPTSSSSAAAAPADVTTVPPSGSAKKRASKLTYCSVKEVWNKTDCAYKIVKVPVAEEVDDYDEYLFVVRSRVDRSTDKVTKYIDIKSAVIRDVLRVVLKDVRGISLNEDRPSIEQNFLFNFLPEIVAHHTAKLDPLPADGTPSKHLDVLLDYLKTEYQPLEKRVQSLFDSNEVTYDLLWTLFKPNTEIFTTCPGTGAPRCVRYNFGEERRRMNGTEYFHIEARYLSFDGNVFGEATEVLSIEEFRGAKQIHLLSAYPLTYHQQFHKLKTRLIECGRKFISLLGVHHRAFEGKAFYVNKERKIVTVSVSKSRIMVDASFFRKRNPNYMRAKVEPTWDLAAVAGLWSIVDDATFFEEEAPVQVVSKDPSKLPEQDLLICSPTVGGYSLDLKMWLEFAVAHVSDIVWGESSFARLALPAGTKKAIQALCEAHLGRDSDVDFEDFVAGKGRGLIALLHGPPGVGKTLTAETISEHLHRPFYTVSAGDLGTTADTLERRLSEILELSSHWKATLLLDEADVFVEKRSANDIHRNALVCVFLRKLEYYDGIMFLTTNRVETIDEAFASRIHMPLRFDALNESARKHVWKGHLGKAVTRHGQAQCSPQDIDRLAQEKLNGREITNVTSTALAMAAFDQTVVSLPYLTDAMKLNQDFQADFKGAGYLDGQRSYI